MISASTQCAAVAWYSHCESGSQLSRQPIIRWLRAARSSQRRGFIGGVGEAAGVQHDLLHGDRLVADAAALGAPTGMMSTIFSSSESRPSSIRHQAPTPTTALVDENMQNRVSSRTGSRVVPWCEEP